MWIALAAAAVVVVGAVVILSDGDDSHLATQTSSPDGSTTPTLPRRDPLEVAQVAIPGDGEELLGPELTFAPNEYGLTNAELDNDGLTPSASIVLERDSAEPMVLSGDGSGTFALTDPVNGDLAVEINDDLATLSWFGVDGSEGSLDIPVPDEVLAGFHQSGLPQSLQAGTDISRPASLAALAQHVQQQGESIQLEARGELMVTFEVDPPDAPVKVRPDLDFCANVPLSRSPPASMLLSPLTCTGALNTSRGAF